MCGLALGEVDPATGCRPRPRVGRIKHESLGGGNEMFNLRTLCSLCHRGAKSLMTPRPTWISLLTQIRRADLREQRAVYDHLRLKFRDSA
jgi:5-methylcytosine-specific restriction endonuclease McrA